MGRQPKGVVIIGAPGAGKSTWAARQFANSPYQDGIVYLSDLNIDDPTFNKYPLVDKRKYRGGKVRFVDYNVSFLEFLQRILAKQFLNKCIILDDTGYFIRYQIPMELQKVANKHRHLGIDLHLMFHGCSEVPIELFKYLKYVVLFYTTDNFAYKGQKVAKASELEAAQRRVNERFLSFPENSKDPEKYRPEIVRL